MVSDRGAVADGIHAVWYLIRDPWPGSKNPPSPFRWSLASLGPPATLR